jgi:hypothetical protein
MTGLRGIDSSFRGMDRSGKLAAASFLPAASLQPSGNPDASREARRDDAPDPR